MHRLLFFYREGCEACKQVRPSVTNLAREYDLPLNTVLATERSAGPLISRYEITEIPTVLLLKDNKVIIESPGPKLAMKAILHYLKKLPHG